MTTKITLLNLTKDEQQLLRGVGGDRRLCDECKRNPSQKKIEKNNGIVKVNYFVCNHCYLDLKQKYGVDSAPSTPEMLGFVSKSRSLHKGSPDPTVVPKLKTELSSPIMSAKNATTGGSGFSTGSVVAKSPMSKWSKTTSGPVQKKTKIAYLYEVRGSKRDAMLVSRVTCNSLSMNGGDVYVLDCTTIVYVWFGSSANEEKRITGITFGKQLADIELARIVCVEEVETPVAFWQAMGGQHLIRPPALDAKVEFRAVLYAVDESRGIDDAADRLVVARGLDIVRSLLNTSMCYVIDAVERIYIWAGAASREIQQRAAHALATALLSERPDIMWTDVVFVAEGSELAHPYLCWRVRGFELPAQRSEALALLKARALALPTLSGDVQAPRIVGRAGPSTPKESSPVGTLIMNAATSSTSTAGSSSSSSPKSTLLSSVAQALSPDVTSQSSESPPGSPHQKKRSEQKSSTKTKRRPRPMSMAPVANLSKALVDREDESTTTVTDGGDSDIASSSTPKKSSLRDTLSMAANDVATAASTATPTAASSASSATTSAAAAAAAPAPSRIDALANTVDVLVEATLKLKRKIALLEATSVQRVSLKSTGEFNVNAGYRVVVSARVIKLIDPSFIVGASTPTAMSPRAASGDEASGDMSDGDVVSLHATAVHRRALYFAGIGRIDCDAKKTLVATVSNASAPSSFSVLRMFSNLLGQQTELIKVDAQPSFAAQLVKGSVTERRLSDILQHN